MLPVPTIDKPVRPALVGTGSLGTLGEYTAGPASVLFDVVRFWAGRPVSVDIETFGLGVDARRMKCVALASGRHAVVFDPRDPDQAALLRDVLTSAGELILHNSAFDVPNLYVNGLFELDWCHKVVDTLIWARLAWPDVLVHKSLEELSKRLLGVTADDSVKVMFKRLGLSLAEGFRRTDIDTPAFLMGNAIDALLTYRLPGVVRLTALDTLTSNHPFSAVGVTGTDAYRLVDREQLVNQRFALPRACKGMRVDLDYLDEYVAKTAASRHASEAELSAAGIRPGNGGDLAAVLDRLGALPSTHPRTPKTGRPSTQAKHLERLGHPLARLFVEVKQVTKMVDDYLSKVAGLAGSDGRVHPELNLLAATTGRASMGNPPIHQFPGDARGILLADEGDALSSIDWSQIEPVVIANVAGDLGPLRGYEDGTSDLYTVAAESAQVPRKTAKVVLLAQLYGEGLAKLAGDLGIGIDEARTIRDTVMGAMPRTRNMTFKLRDIGERYRKIVTISGRIIPVPMGRGFDGGPPSVATHKAVNYFVQGSAYDVLAEALVTLIERDLIDGVYLTMHDELVTSTSIAYDVEQVMRTPPPALCRWAKRTPVLRTDRADLGERWAAA